MIFAFVIIALCGAVSGDVSEIINPSREYLPPARGYLPPSLPKLKVTSILTPAVTTSYQQEPQPPSTALPLLIQNLGPAAPTIVKTVAPIVPLVTNPVSIQREYLPPVIPRIEKLSVRNDNLPLVPNIATPTGITIHSHASEDDLDVLTNVISQPTLNPVNIPQTTADFNPTTITSHPSVVTFVSETSPNPFGSATTSVPEYIQKTGAPLDTEVDSENDPLIRINASELLESFDSLPSEVVEVSTHETVLSEDGYHYSVPLVSFGSLNRN